MYSLSPMPTFFSCNREVLSWHSRSGTPIGQVITDWHPSEDKLVFTPAAQEYQLEPLGNSRTPLPTWFGDTVRNSKRDMVLTRRRHNHRLQPGWHRGLLGCCFVWQRCEFTFPGRTPFCRISWKVCVRRCHTSHGVGCSCW